MDERPFPGPSIVFVEDDPALRSALSFAFEVEGYATRSFASAETARAGDLAAADCLVLDYSLPDGNGLELLRWLRSRGGRVPAILITSHPTACVRTLAALLGAVVIEKPLLSDELADAVRRSAPLSKDSLRIDLPQVRLL